MAIPTQTDMYLYVLEIMQDGIKRSRPEISQLVCKKLNLSDEEQNKKTNSGKRIYESRSNFAVSYLNRAGYLDNLSKGQGVFKISNCGIDSLKENLDSHAFAKKMRIVIRQDNPWKKESQNIKNINDDEIKQDDKSPIEAIEDSIESLNDNLSHELLDTILSKDPAFFEQTVVDLLEAMGYGNGRVTSYSNDGGIDGIISTDSLGFDPIYTQAKKYSLDHRVGRQEIQAFAGALSSIQRGVFITTSSFSDGAIGFAKKYPHATIILIDGKRLTELMIKYDVGVTTEKIYKIKRLDLDYFENE